MNANELADELKSHIKTLKYENTECVWIATDFYEKCETTLRQQQAEIEALKWQIDVLKSDVAGWYDDAQGGVADDEYFSRLFERAQK